MDLYYSKRGVATSIILSIVTCGIYAWVWLHHLLSTLYRQNDMPSNAAMDIVLSFVTCGIYYIYLLYKLGKLESGMHYRLGAQPKDDSILYLILGIFGLWVVVYALLQSNINTLADHMSRGGPGPGGPPPPHGPYGGGSNFPGSDPGRLQ